MLDNVDISDRLTSQRSIIICHYIKHNIKRKRKDTKPWRLGQTHGKKRLINTPQPS